MPTPQMPRHLAQAAVEAVNAAIADGFKVDGSLPSAYSEAARRLKLSPGGINRRLIRAKELYQLQPEQSKPQTDAPKIELPVFPDDDVPVDAILDHLEKREEKRNASFEAHTWFKIKVKDQKPIGILWFGDPHLGDAGCQYKLLRHHCRLCSETDGVYGAQIGDVGNNWTGRLAHLYSQQETSRKTEQKLAEWFMMESGVRWLLWLIGNHDSWNDGATVLAHLARKYGTHKIVLHDWEARFSLAFPNGHEFRVWASHDFKGFSDWNNMHGLLKAARLGVDADLLVGGHRHNYGLQDIENPDKGIAQVLIRARGYKRNDDYARRIGHLEQKNGEAVLTILDPVAKEITPFKNVDLGIRVLKMLRGDA